MRRGDVVLVNFPYADRAAVQPRPALVLQDDALNARLSNTIVASISTNFRGAATQVLIEVAGDDGRLSGLKQDSAGPCENLITPDQGRVRRVIGSLSATLMRRVDDALRAALGL
jgi:mRNA-degrading endonuclease toxin of MazEF toxin-antitoxin module